MIKTGIYGLFDINNSIIENITDVAELDVVGICSPHFDNNNTDNIFGLSNLKRFGNIDAFLNEVDAVIAFSPVSDLDNVELLVRNSKHVLFEPIPEYTNENVSRLVNIIEEANVKVQAGFHYRFNNTFLAAKPFIKKPKFIQSNNFIQFNLDKSSCSVLMDMLINDIDIVLSVIKSNVKKVYANSSTISCSEPDIINVRIEFMNGSVAQLTVGRVSTEDSHIINFYCDKNYTSIDLCLNKAWQIKKRNSQSEVSLFYESVGDLIVDPIPVKLNNHFYDEFSSFAKSIVYDRPTEVDMDTVIVTYQIADQIKEKIKIFM